MKVNAGHVLLHAVVWTSFLGAGAAARPASAQQVEVIANETVLRLDPNASSPAIATLPAGTVLDWVGESGPYLAVTLPGPPGEEDLVGFVLASEVAVQGAAQPSSSIPRPGAAGGGMPIPGVPQQHANAKQKKSAGVGKMVQGGGLAATATLSVSLFFEVEDRESYEDDAAYQKAQDREETAGTVKTVALIGGGALAAWGIGQYVLGWRSMSKLEEEFPEATTAPLDRQYAEATLSRSLGRRKVVWGGILAGGAFAAVEWIPYFGVPDPEDYDDALEYQSAVNLRNDAETGRQWIIGAGSVLGIWGVAQWVLASQKMGEVEELSRMTALSMPLQSSGSEPPVRLFVGRADARTQFGVAWSW